MRSIALITLAALSMSSATTAFAAPVAHKAPVSEMTIVWGDVSLNGCTFQMNPRKSYPCADGTLLGFIPATDKAGQPVWIATRSGTSSSVTAPAQAQEVSSASQVNLPPGVTAKPAPPRQMAANEDWKCPQPKEGDTQLRCTFVVKGIYNPIPGAHWYYYRFDGQPSNADQTPTLAQTQGLDVCDTGLKRAEYFRVHVALDEQGSSIDCGKQRKLTFWDWALAPPLDYGYYRVGYPVFIGRYHSGGCYNSCRMDRPGDPYPRGGGGIRH
jgi:hypothetical protein